MVATFLPLRSQTRSAWMRIALVSEYYFPHLGGVTEHVHNLAIALQRQGHQAIVITAHMKDSAEDNAEPDGEWVHRIGTSRVIFSAGSFARVTTGSGLRREGSGPPPREGIRPVPAAG